MTLRSLLFAGTVLPLALSYPAQVNAQAADSWQLAQADAACPEGEVCPPLEAAPVEPPLEAAPVEPPLEGAQPDQIEPLPEAEAPLDQAQPPLEEAPLPPEEEVIIEEPPPPDEGTMQPPEETPPQPEVDGSQPPEDVPQMEEPPPPDVAPPADIEQVPSPGEIQPEPDMGQLPPPEEIQPQPDVTGEPPVEETTVEQQLEAQGDEEEANRVRTLREQLQQQLREVLGTRPEDLPETNGNRRRDRDRDRPRWWERDDQGEVVEERGGRIVIDLGGGNIYVEPVVPDEAGRLLYDADDVEVQNLRGGRTRTIVTRRNGVQIVTVRDRYGDIVRRTKILPDGTEIVLIDNRFPEDYAGGPPPILHDVPPPVIGIPERQYIVDYGRASPEEIRGALLAPPVQRLERPYTLDEVLRNEQVRAYSPRIDLDTITFDFGSATIGRDQMRALFELGQAMEDVLAERPDEVYLIEGHTDKVGSNYANLILSDQRAEAVATALSQNFNIPPENLVTEGYGEEYPKVFTEEPERRNRRATVRRVTELLQAQNQ